MKKFSKWLLYGSIISISIAIVMELVFFGRSGHYSRFLTRPYWTWVPFFSITAIVLFVGYIFTIVKSTYDNRYNLDRWRAFLKPHANNILLLAFFLMSGTGAYYGIMNNNPRLYNVLDYGAKCDIRQVLDGVTNGTTTFTSATANFTAADVGKAIRIPRGTSSTAATVTTIASVSNSTTVILTAGAAATTSADTVTFGTDNTAAITNTILAGNAVGSDFTVLFPAVGGGYAVAGPCITSYAGANPNCQIPIPTTAYDSANTQQRKTITLLGESPPTSQPVGNTVAPNPRTGSIVESLINGSINSSTPPSIIATKTADVGDFNISANELDIRNMTFFVAANNENGGPTMTAINWFYGGGIQIYNSNFTVDGNIKKINIPTNPAAGIVINQEGGEIMNVVDNVHISGFCYGLISADHTTVNKVSIQMCNYGRVFSEAFDLQEDKSDNLQWDIHLIYVPQTALLGGMVAVGGTSPYSYFKIDALDAESYIGSANWYNTVDMVSDSGGTARADISYAIAQSGVGLTPATQNIWTTHLGAGDSTQMHNIGKPYAVAGNALTANDIGYGSSLNVLTGDAGFTYAGSSSTGNVAQTLSTNAGLKYTMTNLNTGTGASAQFLANGNTYGTEFGQTGSGYTTYGALVTNGGFLYSTAVHLNLMVDNAAGVIGLAAGSAAAAQVTWNGTTWSPVTTATNSLGTASLKWLNAYFSGEVFFGASTSSAASANFPSGTYPTSPNAGDIGYNGNQLYFRSNSTNNNLLSDVVVVQDEKQKSISNISAETSISDTMTVPLAVDTFTYYRGTFYFYTTGGSNSVSNDVINIYVKSGSAAATELTAAAYTSTNTGGVAEFFGTFDLRYNTKVGWVFYTNTQNLGGLGNIITPVAIYSVKDPGFPSGNFDPTATTPTFWFTYQTATQTASVATTFGNCHIEMLHK